MSELPIYAPPSSVHNVYEAFILDPLAQKIIVAPTDASPKSPDSAQFFCSYCNKSFSSYNTWQSHQNSAKHLKELSRRQSGGSPSHNAVSPDKSRSQSTTPNSSPKSSQSIPNPNPKATKEPLPGVNDSEVVKASQMLQVIKQLPNDQYDKLFRLLMMAGQLFCKNYYLKDGAFCLEKLIAVVRTHLAKEKHADELAIIEAKDKTPWLESVVVLHKANLYLARAYRDFAKDIVMEFFYESLLSLMNEKIVDRLEKLVMLGNFQALNDEILNVTSSLLSVSAIIDGNVDENSEGGFALHVYTFMNEFAGYSCESISNTLGVLLYAISIEISRRKNWNIRFAESLKRLTTVLSTLDVNWLAVDYLLEGYSVIRNSNYILEALYMAIDLDDRVRIKRILNSASIGEALKNSEELQLLVDLSTAFVKDDYKTLVQVKQQKFLIFDEYYRLDETWHSMKRALSA